MKLTVTARLTVMTALLTLAILLPTALGVSFVLHSGLRANAIRDAENSAKALAFSAVHQWDEGLLDRGSEIQLETIGLIAPNWAIVRGDRRVVSARGIFLNTPSLVQIGASELQHHGELSYRLASTPLFLPEPVFATLPPAVQERVLAECPGGVFLRARREVLRGETIIEALVLDGSRLQELELTPAGEVLDRDEKRLVETVPSDLIPLIRAAEPIDAIELAAWIAYQGQLIAVVEGSRPTGEVVQVAINRLGERFLLAEDGTIAAPERDSQLWLVTALDASDELAAVGQLTWAVSLGFPTLWIAMIVIGWFVSRQAMSPVQRIVDTVEHIELSNLGERLPDGTADELGRISRTINRMLERIESGYEHERQFTGDASHELRGPIAKVIADIDVALGKERSAAEYRDTLIRCRSYARGMQNLVESLLWLARHDASQPVEAREFELTDLAAGVITVFPTEEASRVQLDLAGEEVVTAVGSPDLIRVLLQNLLQNALRYSPPTSAVRLRIGTANGVTQIDVEDRGKGIPEGMISQVFSRFFRVDRARSRETGGFGLGLAIVDEIARVHGTEVELVNLPEGGLRASFRLPVKQRTSEERHRH